MRERPTYERLRSPAPLVPTRVPSGRRAVEQPNALGDGDARLTCRFWVALLVTGVAAGGFGVVMAAVPRTVQTGGYGDLADGVAHAVSIASASHRVVVLLLGGIATAAGMWAVRRWTGSGQDLDDAVWAGTGEVPFWRSLGSGVLSEVAVGVGGSLGQEAAPKVLGAAAGNAISRWAGLDDQQRRVLVACGAGAGMGAIYNVPLGGALVTAELLLGSLALAALLPALMCSGVATITTWALLPDRPTYEAIGHLKSTPGLAAWAAIVGLLLGLLGVAVVRAVGWASHHQLRGSSSWAATPLAFVVLGLCAAPLPQLLGNGKAIADTAFAGVGAAPLTLLAIVLLKPTLTLLCIWSGAPGGLFTPVLSTGAALGLLAGEVIGSLPLAACAVIGAAALSGATMQAPLAATVLVLELTGSTQQLLLPMLLATALATLVARYIDGYSVFSARLPARSVA